MSSLIGVPIPLQSVVRNMSVNSLSDDSVCQLHSTDKTRLSVSADFTPPTPTRQDCQCRRTSLRRQDKTVGVGGVTEYTTQRSEFLSCTNWASPVAICINCTNHDLLLLPQPTVQWTCNKCWHHWLWFSNVLSVMLILAVLPYLVNFLCCSSTCFCSVLYDLCLFPCQ